MKGTIVLRSTPDESEREKKKGKRAVYAWGIVIELPRGEDGRRKQKWHSVRGSRSKAETELRRLLHEVETGAYVEPVKLTVGQYLDKWLADHAKTTVSPKTYERYTGLVKNQIKPTLGAVQLPKLQPLAIQALYSRLLESGRKLKQKAKEETGLSAQTVVHVHRVLRAALGQAVRWQMVARNPCDAVTPPSVERKQMQALDAARTAWLLTAAEGTKLYTPIVLAATTGMRRGEILALEWSSVNLAAGALSVVRSLEQTRAGGLRFKPTKNKKGRVISLPPMTVEALRQQQARQAEYRALLGDAYQENGLVCCREDGAVWKPEAFTTSYFKFCRKIGVGVRFHDLRHTHASQLLSAGVSPKVVSERLGHSSVGITLDVYSHVLPGIQEEAAAKIDAVLRAEIEKQRRPVT